MRKFLVLLLFLIPVLAMAGVPVAPMQNPRMQFFDSNGKPLAGGKLYFYAAGTSTPLATYSNAAGNAQNPNPVTLDAGGYGTIWMQPSAYKIIAKNSLGVQQWTVDGVNVWFATSPQTYTVATLPTSAAAGQLVTITDGNGQSCTSGSGSTVTLCQWSGITWQAIFAGNGLPDVFASQSAANPKTGAFTSISADSLAAATTVSKQLQQAVYCAQFSGVVCDGVNDDTAGLQACINAGSATVRVVVPNTPFYAAGKSCITTSTLTGNYSGLYLACDSPARAGGNGCVIKNVTGGPIINVQPVVHTGENVTLDPGFTSDGITYVGDAAHDAATIDAININSDSTGNLDSVVINSNFINVRWPVTVNGRNFTFKDNTLSQTYGAFKVVNSGGTSYVANTRTDLRGYHASGNILEGVGGSCAGGPSTGVFSFPNVAAGIIQNVDISNNNTISGWFAPLVEGYNITGLKVSGNVVKDAIGPLLNLGGTTTNLTVTNNDLRGKPWTFGGCAASVNFPGMELGTINGGTVQSNHLLNVGMTAIDAPGANTNLVITGNDIRNASQSAANTYDGIVVGGSSSGSIAHNSITADSGTAHRYGVAAALTPYLHIFANTSMGHGTAALSSAAGNGFDGLPVTTGGSYTPVCTNVTTAGTVSLTGYYRQTGNTVSVQIKWTVAAGAGNTIALTANSSYCTLPAGLSTSYSQPAKLTTGSGYAFAEALFNTGYVTVLQSATGTGTQAAEWILGGTYMLQ